MVDEQTRIHLKTVPHSTEYCRKMSDIFSIFYCNKNIVTPFLSNIAKYFMGTLQLQFSEIFLKKNIYTFRNIVEIFH